MSSALRRSAGAGRRPPAVGPFSSDWPTEAVEISDEFAGVRRSVAFSSDWPTEAVGISDEFAGERSA